jgi:hypothetical protein
MKFFTMNKSDENQINDGILYFSQRIDEMLKHSTYHIYKAPVLNTYLLVEEYLITADQVKKGIIDQSHLKFIFEEFLESFDNDIIIKEYISEEEKTALVNKLNGSTEFDRNKVMHYILHRLSKYDYWCKEYLLKIAPQEKEKRLIEQALRCYIPGLIDRGYSSDYIYYHNKTVFNQSDKNDLELLEEFLNRFDFKKRKYSVYVALHKNAQNFKEILIQKLGVDFDFDISEAKEFKYSGKKYIVAKLEIEALDKRQAANIAYENLDIFYKFYRFMNDDRKKWFLNKCMVRYSDSDYAFVDLTVQRFNFPENEDAEKSSELSELMITALLTNASRGSFNRIDKVISLHNTALENANLSNGFLNLWSILEVLFVSDKDRAKINEIERKAIPLLQKEYMIMLFKDLDGNLKDNLSIEQYNDIINSIDGNDNKYKIAALITLDKYDALRKKIYIYLKNYPILRSRISQMSTLCKRRNTFLNDLERFTRRIIWHIIRLYRTRNSIIHSGDKPNNLKPLGEHLHSYVDVCIWQLMVSLTSEKHLYSIDNVLIDEIFQIEKIIKELSSKEKFKEDDAFLCCDAVRYSKPPLIEDNISEMAAPEGTAVNNQI